MTTSKAQLQDDLTQAIRDKDRVRSGTLRMVLTAVTNAEVAGTESRDLSDEEVTAVVAKEAKKRREAIAAFEDAGRPDRAAEEQSELDVLTGYLPAQLSDEEIGEIVRAAIASTGASGMKDMGAVMKVVQPKIAGRADGSAVAGVVRSELGAG